MKHTHHGQHVVAAIRAIGGTLHLCGVVTVAAACNGAGANDPSQIVEGLRVNQLEELASLIEAGDRFPDLHSLLVMRNGSMVLERYFNGSGADDLHTTQSVTKSFASAFVGIAIAEGSITGVDELVVDFFPQWRDELVQDPRRAVQRVEDILTMRTGTDYHENGPDAPHWQLNALATGWDRFWLDRPMVRDPGSYWQYDSGGAVAVSALLEQRTGVHADGYAERTLFDALDIREASWFRNDEGHVHTGGGLRLRARDMIKLGQLFLQGGVWEGEQVIPASWVETSAQQHVSLNNVLPHVTGYGYFWWILEPDPMGRSGERIYAAFGARAQYVFVVPEHDLVVAVTGDARNGSDWVRPIEFLYTHVLRAVD